MLATTLILLTMLGLPAGRTSQDAVFVGPVEVVSTGGRQIGVTAQGFRPDNAGPRLAVTLTFHSRSDAPIFRNNKRVQILVDGEPLTAGDAILGMSDKQPEGYLMELLVFQMKPSELSRLVEARHATIRIGAEEFLLDRDHLKPLGEMVTRER